MNDKVISGSVTTTQDTPLQNAETRKSKIEEQKLRKACADFESLFVYQLFQTMRKTIPSGNPAMQSFGKDTYNMMFDQKVAEEMSKKGEGMGLQTILFNQLKNSSNHE